MNTNIPEIPPSAPFSPAQIAWLNGFIAGMYSNQPAQGSNGRNGSAVALKPVTILWGSQTGNAESLAKQTSKRLAKSGFKPAVFDMAEYDSAKLSSEELLLIITSTYGDGEPPDNAMELHKWLHSEAAPKLDKTRFSVLALGDTNYPDFCKCGIEFDTRLRSLGAMPIIDRVDCDVDFDESYENWLSSLETSLSAMNGKQSVASKEDSKPANQSSEPYGKKNPFPARVLLNRNLNGTNSAKETRHLEISLEGSGFSYKPGDALAVLPQNCPEYVANLVAVLGFEGSEPVVLPSGDTMSLRDALVSQFDVTGLGSKVVKGYKALAKSDNLDTLVEDKATWKEYTQGRQFIDLIETFPADLEDPRSFVSILPKLAPRLYSISSSHAAHGNEVHLTVGAVRYHSFGKNRKGVCSTYLADHDGKSLIKIFFHETKSFVLPEDDSKPIIMVGPGTGIAPFRAFLEERKARGAAGKNWLFFGDQHAACDFLYQDEIERFFSEGLLSRFDTAFSRDQDEKVYVQNRMLEQGQELFSWLEEGACFYVCGDASRMAKDVDKALHDVVKEHGRLSETAAQEYVKKMKSQRRYLRDVY